jgi:hypothetical protein
VELAAFDLRAEEAFVGEAGELAGEVGGVGGEGDGQLADVDARGSVDVEERQDLASELGAERERCSRVLLHLQWRNTAVVKSWVRRDSSAKPARFLALFLRGLKGRLG